MFCFSIVMVYFYDNGYDRGRGQKECFYAGQMTYKVNYVKQLLSKNYHFATKSTKSSPVIHVSGYIFPSENFQI